MAEFLSQEEIDTLLDIVEDSPDPIIESKERSYIRGLLESFVYRMNDDLSDLPERQKQIQEEIQEYSKRLKEHIHVNKEIEKFKEIEPELFI